MKKLGIIGGAGPLASSLFYETLVHECYQLQSPLPEILLLNYPFHRGLTVEEKKENGSVVQQELLHCVQSLQTGGATFGVLICNTLHLELGKASQGSIPFFSIPTLVLEEIRKKKKRRLLLLGTQNTCLSSLYQHEELTIFCPCPENQRIVDSVIDNILEGKLLAEDALSLERIISSFPQALDGVILGCTDLPVLHHHFPIRAKQPIFDSVKIPAKRILLHLQGCTTPSVARSPKSQTR